MLNNDEAKAKKDVTTMLLLSLADTYNTLAKDNQVAYYSTVTGCFGYDRENEKPIDLQDGEINNMMQSETNMLSQVQLQKIREVFYITGDAELHSIQNGFGNSTSFWLSKIITQQFCPQLRATLRFLPTRFLSRFPTGNISKTDLMKGIKEEAYNTGLDHHYFRSLNEVLQQKQYGKTRVLQWGTGSAK